MYKASNHVDQPPGDSLRQLVLSTHAIVNCGKILKFCPRILAARFLEVEDFFVLVVGCDSTMIAELRCGKVEGKFTTVADFDQPKYV